MTEEICEGGVCETDPILHLDEFCPQDIEIIKAFWDDWKARNKRDPEEWPLRMRLSQWHEQLAIFHDQTNPDDDLK